MTEHNIDLNRNNLDHGAGHPANEKYAEIHALLTPRDWTGPGRERADAAIAAYIREHGMFAFQEAVSGGQYDFPDGLFFGGRALSWSAQTWQAIVDAHCRGARRVAHLDFHTGLGDHGACEIISVESADGAGAGRARRWYGDAVKSPERNDSLSAVVTGSMENGFDDIAQESEVTSVALEYGTQSLPEVLEALRADNWLHLYGDPASDAGRAIKRQIRDAFYGDTAKWKRMIWETAGQGGAPGRRRTGGIRANRDGMCSSRGFLALLARQRRADENCVENSGIVRRLVARETALRLDYFGAANGGSPARSRSGDRCTQAPTSSQGFRIFVPGIGSGSCECRSPLARMRRAKSA